MSHDLAQLLRGLVLGFSIAAPVGPIGVLCIRRSIAEGRVAGFVSGLGAATADAIYGIVAALGLTAIMQALLDQRVWLQLGGGVFLVWLGVSTFRARTAPQPADVGAPPAAPRLFGAYTSTLALTLTNPMTILSFVGIFAGMGVGAATSGARGAIWLVAGVFTGSALWWLFLSLTAGWLGRRVEAGGLARLNRVSGVMIAGFGGWQLLQLARS